jgi:DNA-directed RNA polymerase subunit A"
MKYKHFEPSVEKFAEKRKLSKPLVTKLKKAVDEWLDSVRIDPWYPAGLVAAESMGEPATQATLRTFHFAGAAEVSVTSGVDRMLEIADALRKIKTPSMKIYLNEPYNKDEAKAREFALSLQETYLKDVAKISEDYFTKEIRIDLDEKAIKERGLDKDEIVKKIAAKVKKKVEPTGNTIILTFKDSDMSLMKIRKLRMALEKLHLAGVKGIRFAVVGKDGDEYVVNTSGTNLKAIWNIRA